MTEYSGQAFGDRLARSGAAHALGSKPAIESAELLAGSGLASRLGRARRVLFYGKSMSRTRCTGALVDALQRHGLEVRWRNLGTWRRWFGKDIAHRLARAEFRRYRPDVVFVFFRDLPQALAAEFRRSARFVIWCEESLEALDPSILDYFRLADLVCMSNPARFPWLREQGLDNMVFQLSGFAPRFHHPGPARSFERDIAFIGSPGCRAQRPAFLAEIAKHFDLEVFGKNWDRWRKTYPGLRAHRQVDNRAYAKICATSRIVLGVNDTNDDEFYFSNRTFLTMACGGFHLTHYVPRLENVFRNEEHLVWFRGEEDALQKIRDWLPRDAERARIAAAGHNQVMQFHQYFHRVAHILQRLEHGVADEWPAGVVAPAAGGAGGGGRRGLVGRVAGPEVEERSCRVDGATAE